MAVPCGEWQKSKDFGEDRELDGKLSRRTAEIFACKKERSPPRK